MLKIEAHDQVAHMESDRPDGAPFKMDLMDQLGWICA